MPALLFPAALLPSLAPNVPLVPIVGAVFVAESATVIQILSTVEAMAGCDGHFFELVRGFFSRRLDHAANTNVGQISVVHYHLDRRRAMLPNKRRRFAVR